MQRLKHLVVFAAFMMIAGGAAALVAPRDGGRLPQAFYDIKAKDPSAFTMKRAWIQKKERIRARREAFLAERAAEGPLMLTSLPEEYAVSGTIQVPVFLCEFNNRPAPFDSVTMQNQLFGNNPSGSVTDYYQEASYGYLTMTGTVYDVVTLEQSDTYYEGLPGCNGTCSSGRIGQLLTEVLDAKDPIVDFGQYDNDGPDGIPNSGDDDGYVDFVSFVQPEFGGECGGNDNIWSHRSTFEWWPESGDTAYMTDDPAYGGGYIRISDYTMQPALNCDGATIIDIGVFCHEFGHALGLPDLYDTIGAGWGIGYWGIMGAGNWNTPSSPAHPCAWTRVELGWVIPTDITWEGGLESIDRTATSGDVLRLGFTSNRFRRSHECTITGAYSLYCGLTVAEGQARGWPSEYVDRGYGNTWHETVEHDFTFDGTTPVTFTYNYQHDTEATYDFGYAIIEVEGTETVLPGAVYTGAGSGLANHDLTPYLSGLTPPATYTLKFRGTSDIAWADEDGGHNSDCGLLVIDDVTVTGGGENYSADFETDGGGWYQSPDENPRAEYWLIENRQPYGYDAHLMGTGLLIMHVDETVVRSTLGNSGGSTNSRVRGLVVEEGDGNFNLIRGVLNPGDAGDTFPGSSDNRTFNSTSWPDTKSNAWVDTQIEVTDISNSGVSMTANARAGDPAPAAALVTPNGIDNDQVAVDVAITGNGFQVGATFRFTYSGAASAPPDRTPNDSQDIVASSVRWIDSEHLEGTINVYSKTGGSWDLIVVNPDNQQFTLSDAISINQLVAVQLQSASIEVVDGAVRLEYVLIDREPDETLRLSRSLSPESDSRWTVIAEDLQPVDGQRYTYVDSDVEPGTTYFYRLDVLSGTDGIRELHKGSAAVPAGELSLSQNFPNPFNPTTSIAFYLPQRTKLRLEVYDVAGRLVARLAGGVYEAGAHRVDWNGTNADGTPVSSGVYVYRLTAGKRAISKKMILLK
jgi:M6 family metalloprotease-like protein